MSLLFTLGCGSESVLTGGNAIPSTQAVSGVETELEAGDSAPAAAAPVFGDFWWELPIPWLPGRCGLSIWSELAMFGQRFLRPPQAP